MQSTLNTSLFTQITPSEQEALSGGGKSVKVKFIVAKVFQNADAKAVSIGKGVAVAKAENYSNISID